MNPEQACPWCGSTDLVRTIPEKAPFDTIVICNQCQRALTGHETPTTTRTSLLKRKIEDTTTQLCLNQGLVVGIKYYLTEYNKIPGNNLSLLQAKQAVEALLEARGLTRAVKKPNKNGCVIVLILILLAIASIIYFYSNR
ncbi:hypothetical protein [Chitinophaga nivalis]|uniref:TFIIB-type zinc ribbon-containing protein n=1 Tax=Chitinophaga nivalis TaxID=2991709 RepID=A0ABT3IPN5_9BACT|nr:hypothetical protein [Chitinophaga nivalis]MCW3464372.1 hypothetical protein [Chitinophaga nivalis]MCW3485937.1 hypothetical protein [Chitinophaga nivalis]